MEPAAPITIPTSLEAALEALGRTLDPGAIEGLRSGRLKAVDLHNGVGRWMRNNWGLWKQEGPLHAWFVAKGLDHADDMSGVILETYQRHLQGRKLDVDDQIRRYQRFWRAAAADASLCEHANENPAVCSCNEGCYCEAHTCIEKPKTLRAKWRFELKLPNDDEKYFALVEELEKKGVPVPKRVRAEATGQVFADVVTAQLKEEGFQLKNDDEMVQLYHHKICLGFIRADGSCPTCLYYPSSGHLAVTVVPRFVVDKMLNENLRSEGFLGPTGLFTKKTT